MTFLTERLTNYFYIESRNDELENQSNVTCRCSRVLIK